MLNATAISSIYNDLTTEQPNALSPGDTQVHLERILLGVEETVSGNQITDPLAIAGLYTTALLRGLKSIRQVEGLVARVILDFLVENAPGYSVGSAEEHLARITEVVRDAVNYELWHDQVAEALVI